MSLHPNPASVQILDATPADLPAIARLAAAIWRAYYPGIITHAQIDYMLDRMYSQTQMELDLAHHIHYHRLLVDAQLAGFSAHGPTPEPRTGKLHKLYVDPARHGQGLGRTLLHAAETRARTAGWDTLILQVNKRNLQAIAFYRRTGFSIREEATFDIGHGYVMDDYIMTKPLTPTPNS